MSLISSILSIVPTLALMSVAVLTVNEPPLNMQGSDRTPSSSPGVTYLSRAARIAREHGVDSVFVASLLRSPQTSFNDRFVRMNVTNYAQKTDYSHNHNERGVRKVREFTAMHDTVLNRIDSLYGVPPYVVAALLWVESKHGTVLGKYHVASVYLSVLLSCEPEFVEQNTLAVMVGMGRDSTKLDSIKRYVEQRAVKKTKWAADQIKALRVIDQRGILDAYTLYGSWAGAFGMSQFLPSSYLSWAVDGDNNGVIDLNDIDDAMYSVANYLKCNGWGQTSSQQRAAVYHYNNSSAYVDAVLTLARKAR